MMMRLLTGLLLFICAGSAMATEEPSYTVLEQSGDFELRAYNPMIVAETQVSGPMDDASGAGFRLIADYIFGNNTSRTGGNKKISMTAPVTMEPESEKISMTAPVSMEQTGEQWRVHFVMPSQYTLDTLPRPNNPAVSLREVPASNYAVIRFSGLVGEKKRATEGDGNPAFEIKISMGRQLMVRSVARDAAYSHYKPYITMRGNCHVIFTATSFSSDLMFFSTSASIHTSAHVNLPYSLNTVAR